MTESTLGGAAAAVAAGLCAVDARGAGAPPSGRFGSGVVQISQAMRRGELRKVHVGQAICWSSGLGDGDGVGPVNTGGDEWVPAAESGRECGMPPAGARTAEMVLASSDRSREMPHMVQLTRRSAAPAGEGALPKPQTPHVQPVAVVLPAPLSASASLRLAVVSSSVTLADDLRKPA